jgi:hypothetical protein
MFITYLTQSSCIGNSVQLPRRLEQISTVFGITRVSLTFGPKEAKNGKKGEENPTTRR